MANTTQHRRELMTIVNKFYAKPAARVSLELFITIGVIMFFAVFAIRPTLLTMSDLIKEIEDKRKLDQALTQKVAALSTGQTEYLNVQPRLTILDEAIPPDPNLVEALKIIEKIASDTQTAVAGIVIPELPQVSDPNTTPTNVAPSRQDFTLTITLIGDYTRARNFVAGLQAAQRVFIVESINFSISEAEGEPMLVTTVNINMPYFGVNQAGPPPAAPTPPPGEDLSV